MMNRVKRLPNFPFAPGRWPFFYGWMILCWGTLGIVMSIPGQTTGVSIFTDSLLAATGMSRNELSMAYMFGTMGSSFMLPWVGARYDKLGVRPMAVTAAVGLGLVLIFFSRIDVIIFDILHIQQGALWVFIITLLGFMFLRFFGQGVLTMVSRNMMAQWFESWRGFATGFSNVVVSLTFSSAPVFLHFLVELYTWRGAWMWMALIVGGLFPWIVLIFFRNRPEDSGLVPDGALASRKRRQQRPVLFPVVKQFTLAEARRNYAFWVFALMMGMQALYITGFTFHVLSVFDHAGFTAEQAITVFQPSAIIALVFTLAGSSLSDYIPLKYLLYVKGMGACIGIIGMIFLEQWAPAYYLLIIGNGIMSGLFSVLTTVSWPRYFGREHLGAISGQAMMVIVFGSALGPILFSESLSIFHSYQVAGWGCLVIYIIFTVAAFRANNPQIKAAAEIK